MLIFFFDNWTSIHWEWHHAWPRPEKWWYFIYTVRFTQLNHVDTGHLVVKLRVRPAWPHDSFLGHQCQGGWFLPLYKARAGAQQEGWRAGRRSRLVGWWPMCGGLSEVAARLKVEADWQHHHLVRVLGQRKWGCVKSFVSVSLLLVRHTVITGSGYFALNTHSKCQTSLKVKWGEEMQPEQNERGTQGLYYDILSLELLDSIVYPVI